MIKYEYVLDKASNTLKRVPLITYPEMSVLEDGIAKKIPIDYFKSQILLATQGEHEAPLLQIENEWFSTYKDEEKLKNEVTVINEKLENENSKSALETLEKRKKEILGFDKKYFNDLGKELTTRVSGELEYVENKRKSLEEENPWLQKYLGIETDIERPDVISSVTISNDNIKKLIAYERDMTVRNVEDTLADLAKMNSLLFSVVSKIYEILPSEQIDNIPADEKTIIEYALESFKNINTRADLQLAEEGEVLIDKLMNRESEIAKIVTELQK